MTKSSPLIERLRDALFEERIAGAAYRARRAPDTFGEWNVALDKLDDVVKEIDAALDERDKETEHG